MRCDQVRSRLADLSSGQVRSRREKEIYAHLDTCPRCSSEWRSFNHALTWLDHFPEESPPANLWQRVEQRIASQGSRSPAAVRFHHPWQWTWRTAAAAGLAGCVALALVGAFSLTRVSRTYFPSGISGIAKTNATLFCQHVSMDRGEPFADNVALGAMASLVTHKMDLQRPASIPAESTP